MFIYLALNLALCMLKQIPSFSSNCICETTKHMHFFNVIEVLSTIMASKTRPILLGKLEPDQVMFSINSLSTSEV
jgi:hypothetical protein